MQKELDEDSLNRESTDEAPTKRGPGRPPGYPKSGGRIRGKIPGQKYNDAEAHTVLGSMMPDVVKFHYEVMQGKTKASFSGPTGKPVERFPNLPERQASANWITENFWRLDEKLKEAAVIAKAKGMPEGLVEEVDPNELRKAVLEDLMAHVRPAPPPPVDDTPSANPSPAPDFDDTHSEVISVTDPKQIAEFDRTISAGETSKPRNRDSNRIELGEGFFALPDVDRASGQQRWACFNAEGQHCAYKSSREACERWFFENTIPGQLLAKAKRVV
jgi:hypothetical protein